MQSHQQGVILHQNFMGFVKLNRKLILKVLLQNPQIHIHG